MEERKLCAVTGGFGYTGGYISRRLLDRGHGVRVLTRDPGTGSPHEGGGGAVAAGL